MTINLDESINSILKKRRNLPISYMVIAIYTYCNKFFTNSGRQVATMILIMSTLKLHKG